MLPHLASSTYSSSRQGPSLYRLTGKQPLWQWSEVAEWLASYEKIPKQLAEHAELVSHLNLALQLRDKKVRAKVGELMEVLPNIH